MVKVDCHLRQAKVEVVRSKSEPLSMPEKLIVQDSGCEFHIICPVNVRKAVTFNHCVKCNINGAYRRAALIL